MRKVRKTLSKPVKILLFAFICVLLLLFWWALLKFPAFTPSGAFRKIMKENLISGVEERLVLKYTDGKTAVVLGESEGAVYQLELDRSPDRFFWSQNKEIRITPAADGAYIVPLRTVYLGSGAYDYLFAAYASGSRAELDFVVGERTFSLLPAGKKDGWFLFRYQDENWTRFAPDGEMLPHEYPPLNQYVEWMDRIDGIILPAAPPVELHLRVFDAQDRLIRETVRSFQTDKIPEELPKEK